MSEYTTIEHYVNHVMGEITKRDVEQVSERLRALGWEEVVRCRDCKFGVDSGKYCAEGCADSWDWRNVEPDGYCAWGRKKDK